MARPKAALISKRKALETALKIIDQDGLEGLSIRRLADALGVNGASLYHHFKDKEDILVKAAESALADVTTPVDEAADWREWLPANARKLREALIRHPALIPVVVRRRTLGMGARTLDTWAARLIEEGVPSAAVIPVLDSLVLFAIGSALHDTVVEPSSEELESLRDSYPTLVQTTKDRGLTADEVFDVTTVSILETIQATIKERQDKWTPQRNKRGPRKN